MSESSHPDKPNIHNTGLLNYPYFSIIIFTALLLASVISYEGGSLFEHSTSEYSITQNFLSDLGREFTFRKKENTASRIFFGFSMAAIASGFAVLSFNSKDQGLTKGKLSAFTAALSGIISSIFLAASGLFPWDTMFRLHVWSVNFAFLFIFLYLIFTVYVQVVNKIPRQFYLLNSFAAICIIIQLLLLLFGPHYRTKEGLPFQVIVQKIIVAVFIVNMMLQSYGVKNKRIKTRARTKTD